MKTIYITSFLTEVDLELANDEREFFETLEEMSHSKAPSLKVRLNPHDKTSLLLGPVKEALDYVNEGEDDEDFIIKAEKCKVHFCERWTKGKEVSYRLHKVKYEGNLIAIIREEAHVAL